MRAIKTYEGFLSKIFGKAKIKTPITKINVVHAFSKDDILNIFQEISDDFNLNITKNRITVCELVSTKIQMNTYYYFPFKDIDGKSWFLNPSSNIKYFRQHNAYCILLQIDEDSAENVNKDELVRIMEHKKELYGFDYVILDKTLAVDPTTGLRINGKQWRVFIL